VGKGGRGERPSYGGLLGRELNRLPLSEGKIMDLGQKESYGKAGEARKS